MKDPCEDGCIVKGICSEICEKYTKYHEHLQSELIKSIAKRDPHIIVLEGSVNPTYASDSFYDSLVDFNGDLVQYGLEVIVSIVTTTKEEWIKKVITSISSGYKIRRIGDVNYVGDFESCEEYEKEYIENGNFPIDCGGILWSTSVDKIKNDDKKKENGNAV